ncbi:MAG: hypothetical protein V1838_01180 [Patescibacteria group bacterium]
MNKAIITVIIILLVIITAGIITDNTINWPCDYKTGATKYRSSIMNVVFLAIVFQFVLGIVSLVYSVRNIPKTKDEKVIRSLRQLKIIAITLLVLTPVIYLIFMFSGSITCGVVD